MIGSRGTSSPSSILKDKRSATKCTSNFRATIERVSGLQAPASGPSPPAMSIVGRKMRPRYCSVRKSAWRKSRKRKEEGFVYLFQRMSCESNSRCFTCRAISDPANRQTVQLANGQDSQSSLPPSQHFQLYRPARKPISTAKLPPSAVSELASMMIVEEESTDEDSGRKVFASQRRCGSSTISATRSPRLLEPSCGCPRA